MNYHIRRKLAYVLMALISSHIWYYLLVDGLCDTAFASIGFSIAQILGIVLPFLCCLIWNKEKSYNRAIFVITYFIVQTICNYFHSFMFNVLWDISENFNLSLNMTKIQFILVLFIMLMRIILSLSLVKWSFRHVMIAIIFNTDSDSFIEAC